MEQFYKTRENGPNLTTRNKSVKVAGYESNVSLTSMDTDEGRVIESVQLNTSESELPKSATFIKSALGAELDDALASGKTRVIAPPVEGADEVAYKQLAAEKGAEYSNGAFTLGSKKAVDVNALALSAANAINAGYSKEDVEQFLLSQGVGQESLADVFGKTNSVAQAKAAGYSDEEILQFITADQPVVDVETTLPELDPEESEWITTQWGAVQAPKRNSYAKLVSENVMDAEELLTSMKVLAPHMSSFTTRISGFFGNQEAAAKAEAGALAGRNRIIEMAQARGLDLVFDERAGKFLANTENGPVAINESAWADLLASSGEVVGGVSGALAGARLGRVGGWPGMLAGSMAGAAGGAAVGSQLDYMYQAIKLQEDFEGQVMLHKALTAAEISVIGDVVGFGIFKSAGVTASGLKRVKDFVLDGNTKGAYKALKEMEFLTDAQAEEMVARLARISSTPVPGATPEAQRIAAVSTTKPGAESLIQAAASFDSQASRSVVNAIDQRAKDLLATTNELSGENLGRLFREDLTNYVADVKGFYDQVKIRAAQAPGNSNFAFDYNKLAIQPVIDSLQKNISDPTVLARFQLQAERVRSMSDSRTFTDLLELRQVVNEFKFNKRITKQKDFDTLNKVLNNIDSAINDGAQSVFRNADDWLEDYAQARAQYARMKSVERNVMYKALTRPGIGEDEIATASSRYITALDGTFEEVLSSLPTQLRGRVENSVLDTLANKYTAGVGESIRAVNFPMLADDLKKVSFTTKDARAMKAAVEDMAEVFRNDVPIAQISGSIQIPKFQSYLTADPVVRAKYELASGLFNYAKTLLPNKQQNSLALVRKTTELLQNPLNSKSVKELMEEAAGRVDISEPVLQLQREAARAAAAGKDLGMPRAKLYGSGKVLSAKKGSGPEQSVPMHRIATHADARTVAEAEGLGFADVKLIDQALKARGYLGVQQGTDHVRLLGD